MSSPKRKKRALPSRNNTINTPEVGSTCPTCVDFGKDRKEKYPAAFFCSNCDAWDLEPPNSRSKQNSRRFKCQAKLGPNWFHPTTVQTEWCRNTVETKECGKTAKRNKEGGATPPPPTTTGPASTGGKKKKRANKEPLSKVIIRLRCQLAVQKRQFEAQERRIASLQEEKNRLHSNIAYWKDMTENNDGNNKNASGKQRKTDKPESLHIGIIDAITSLVTEHYSRFGMERVGKEIAKAALSMDLFRGVGLKK
jgi:hypothetical protein